MRMMKCYLPQVEQGELFREGVQAYLKRGLPLVTGMEIGYDILWQVDTGRDASEFDAENYRTLKENT